MQVDYEPVPETPQGNSVAGLGGAVDVALTLRAAVESVGCSHKVAAALVGYGVDYWSRVLSGERGILLARLGQLPRDVQLNFVMRWAAALGYRIERRDTAVTREIARTLADAAARLAEVL